MQILELACEYLTALRAFAEHVTRDHMIERHNVRPFGDTRGFAPKLVNSRGDLLDRRDVQRAVSHGKSGSAVECAGKILQSRAVELQLGVPRQCTCDITYLGE